MNHALRSNALWSKLDPVELEPVETVPAWPSEPKQNGNGRPPRRTLLILILLGLGAIATAGAIVWKHRGIAAVDYATAPVERGDIVRVTTASGMVNPVETVQIGSYVSGRILDLFCDYNSKVATGQHCAKIDPRSYQAAVEQASAAVGTAKAQLSKDQAQLTYRKVAYDRSLALLNRNVVSQDATDNALSVYNQAQAQVALDQAAISQREAELKAAQVNLDYTDIVSPVDGTVVSRSAAIGQTVTANFQTPTLFLIATDLSKMQVEANVSEAEIGEVREGQNATFTVEAFPGRTFSGRVRQIRQAPVAVQNVISYDVVIATDNSDLALKPGMTATAHIVLAQAHDVVRIPEAALRFAPEGFAVEHARAGESKSGLVWVKRPEGLVPIAVQLGLADENDVAMTEGELKPGDEVVTGRHRGGDASAVNAPSTSGAS
jgi:HlyD family secretion protein